MLKLSIMLVLTYGASYGLLRATHFLVRYESCCSGQVIAPSTKVARRSPLDTALCITYLPLSSSEGVVRDWLE